jgi:phosphoribosylaminoimidazole-succinocarboxamide synthase
MKVETREKLYEGKAKIVYETNKPGMIIQYFKDDATAFNALKKGTIVGKGVVNNRMSAALFERLGRAGSRRTTSRRSPIARCCAIASTSS